MLPTVRLRRFRPEAPVESVRTRRAGALLPLVAIPLLALGLVALDARPAPPAPSGPDPLWDDGDWPAPLPHRVPTAAAPLLDTEIRAIAQGERW